SYPYTTLFRSAFDSVFVHRFAGELILGGRVFGEDAHGLAGGIGVFKAVHHHGVDDDIVADAGAAAVLVHQIGGAGHRLHAARDDDVGAAGGEGVGRHHHGLQARAAHLVHGGRLDMLAEAGADGGLAGGGLAQTGRQDAAHVDLFDLLRRDAGALDRSADGRGAQLGRLHAVEGALEAAHGRTGEG